MCVLCGQEPARAHGAECRRCYQRLWKRRQRQTENRTKLQHLSIEQAEQELDKQAYMDWYYDE